MKFRLGTRADINATLEFYRVVARTRPGLVRAADEITHEYIEGWVEKCLARGIWVLGEDAEGIIASIHASKMGPRAQNHILADLTLAVHLRTRGLGVGGKLFERFFEETARRLPEVSRVELFAIAFNETAVKLYESVGFQAEGRFRNRIADVGSGFHDSIPMAWHRPLPASVPEIGP